MAVAARSAMTFADAILLFAAGYLSGVVNAIAGGGTFLTFGAMTLTGLPPIVANATSSITQFPGSEVLGSAVSGEGMRPLPVNSNSCWKVANGVSWVEPATAVPKKRLWS